jgi:hypothetical protein
VSRRSHHACVVGVAAATLLVVGAPAHAVTPPHEHISETSFVEGLALVCDGLVLTVTGGTQVEKVVSTSLHGVVRINIVRTYHGLTFSGSDGATYRATSTAHQSVLLADPDDDEPLATREVIQLTFRGSHGSPGSLHEVFTIRDGVETDVITGNCDFA